MSRRRFIALSLVLDAVLVNAGFVLAFLLRFGGTLPAFNFDPYLLLSPAIIGLHLASGYVYGLYDTGAHRDAVGRLRASRCSSVLVATVLTAALAFFGGPATASFAALDAVHRVLRRAAVPRRVAAAVPALRHHPLARAAGRSSSAPGRPRSSSPTSSPRGAGGATGSTGLVDPNTDAERESPPDGGRLSRARERSTALPRSPRATSPTASSS